MHVVVCYLGDMAPLFGNKLYCYKWVYNENGLRLEGVS
jgi:hypothetical protein